MQYLQRLKRITINYQVTRLPSNKKYVMEINSPGRVFKYEQKNLQLCHESTTVGPCGHFGL